MPGQEFTPLLTVSIARTAVRCLINAKRDELGRRPLRRNAMLGRAAQSHADDLLSFDYVGHRGPDGGRPPARIADSGYFRGFKSGASAELIGMGAGQGGSPAAMVRSWLRSKNSRSVVLARRARDFGVGVGIDNFGPERAFYVANFGVRGR